jgi:fluoroacetyl-CoA thioesterase
MSKPVPIGARGEASEIVEHKHTLTYYDKRLPPVYSTPDMVRLMEIAGLYAMQPYAEGDEITVGTAINIEHRAAALLGSKITAEAIVEKIDGRFYTLRVRAWDDKQEIGIGTIGRTFVSLGKIMAKFQIDEINR